MLQMLQMKLSCIYSSEIGAFEIYLMVADQSLLFVDSRIFVTVLSNTTWFRLFIMHSRF